jgi:hypothetical protein
VAKPGTAVFIYDHVSIKYSKSIPLCPHTYFIYTSIEA